MCSIQNETVMVGITNKARKADDAQAVEQPGSTCEGGEIHWREAEREPASLPVLLCKAISKRKYCSRAGVKEIMETRNAMHTSHGQPERWRFQRRTTRLAAEYKGVRT